MKDISELLGCRYPFIQGAMGVICNPEFVAAVSEAEAYGLLATAFETDPGKLKARVDAVDVPVVAAGGIGDSRGYKAAFCLAAVGVQVGTAFIAAEECIAHANYKNALPG